MRVAALAVLCLLGVACARAGPSSATDANAGIDSLNARLVRAYREHDPQRYASLFTDTAVFEWPAVDNVRRRAGMALMAQGNWASLRDMDLRLTVSTRRIAADHATELGAFEQSYRDSTGARSTEFGRYATVLARQPDGTWLMDRFLGFSDSTRSRPAAP